MRGAAILIGAVLPAAVVAGPALAERSNARPAVLSARVVSGDGGAVSLRVVGRDADDVVRGVEVRWGAAQPALGESACEVSSRRGGGGDDERRRGRRASFRLSYVYPAAGDYNVTVRAISGGCGARPQQRSAPRRLTVQVR
jgi:hypothetical protein